jgi:hypothetical protein
MSLPLKNSWLFPVIQSVHLVGLAILVGSIILVDLRLLDYGLRRFTNSKVSDEFKPWTRLGFAVMFVTGPILFFADAERYIHNPAFLFKIAALAVAAMVHFSMLRRTKMAAVISITLWTIVVLAARAIADFDI